MTDQIDVFGMESTIRPLGTGALAIALAVCIGCGGATPERDAAAPLLPADQLPDRAEFIDGGLGVTARSRTELQSLLGPADSVTAEEIANRHVPGMRDTIYTLYHPGRMTRIHHPGGGGDLLSMVEVSDNRHLRYPILGLEVEALQIAFGPPDQSSDSSVVYRCISCVAGDDPVEFLLEGDTVRRVRFHFYVD